jgi:hypothetical protein
VTLLQPHAARLQVLVACSHWDSSLSADGGTCLAAAAAPPITSAPCVRHTPLTLVGLGEWVRCAKRNKHAHTTVDFLLTTVHRSQPRQLTTESSARRRAMQLSNLKDFRACTRAVAFSFNSILSASRKADLCLLWREPRRRWWRPESPVSTARWRRRSAWLWRLCVWVCLPTLFQVYFRVCMAILIDLPVVWRARR